MKRGCSSSSDGTLTGGTGDVNPQSIVYNDSYGITNAAMANFFSATIPNPSWDLNRSIAATSCAQKKAFVLEVLKVMFYLDPAIIGSNAAVPIFATQGVSLVQLNTAPQPPASSSAVSGCLQWLQQQASGPGNVQTNSSLIAMCHATNHVTNGTITASINDTQSCVDNMKVIDVTDGAGHGVIVGTQNLQVLAYTRYSSTPGVGATQNLAVQIMYRYKQIPYDEFIRQYTFGY